MYEGPVQELIDELSRLPGIGPRGAARIAFHLLDAPVDDVNRLSDLLRAVKKHAKFCSVCFNISQEDLCRICRDQRRDRSMICVVEESKDVIAIERTREFRGLYHVLGGSISPIDGRGPADLHTRELFQRLADPEIKEVILATDPDTQGEATAAYLSRMLVDSGIRVTRPASGLPVGGDLEYADQVTLGRAFEGRRDMHAPRREPQPQPIMSSPVGSDGSAEPAGEAATDSSTSNAQIGAI